MTSERAGPTAYSVAGSGPPLILVHGLGLNRAMWQWQSAALAERYTVVSYDLLGHGDSERLGREYRMSDMVGQLSELRSALGISSCALLGFSLGGLIVQAAALAEPESVSALVVMHAAHARTQEQREAILLRVRQSETEGPGSTVGDALKRWFSDDFANGRPDVLNQVRDWVLSNDREEYPRLYRLLANGDIGLETAIGGIQCPCLVMTGEEDFGNSPDMARTMAEKMPNAVLLVLPGLRHMALAEDPETVNRALLSFVDSAAV